MALSLREQVAIKCVHFNGLMSKVCKAGVAYDDVKDASVKLFRLPCLQQGGACAQAKFRTPGEVEQYIQEMEGGAVKGLAAYLKVKDHVIKTKEQSGKVACDCGGELRFSVAQSNGHIWARCNSCGIFFNE